MLENRKLAIHAIAAAGVIAAPQALKNLGFKVSQKREPISRLRHISDCPKTPIIFSTYLVGMGVALPISANRADVSRVKL